MATLAELNLRRDRLLEPEHLPFSLNRDLPNGNRIRAGIEFDRIGRRVAYHLYREHPGEQAMGGMLFGDPVPVPASEVIHLFRPLRPGQIRGEPWLTQALVKHTTVERISMHGLFCIASMLIKLVKDPTLFVCNGISGMILMVDALFVLV